MSTAEFPYKAWLSSYGAEDERAAQADYERRAKAQAAIEWLIDNDLPTARAQYSVTTISDAIDFRAALEAAYLAGLEDKGSTR